MLFWVSAPLGLGGQIGEIVGAQVLGDKRSVFPHAVARAFDLDDDSMMQKPVEQRLLLHPGRSPGPTRPR